MNISAFLDDYTNIVMITSDNFVLSCSSKLYIVDKFSNKYCSTKILKKEIKDNSHIYYINASKSLIIGEEYYITDGERIIKSYFLVYFIKNICPIFHTRS